MQTVINHSQNRDTLKANIGGNLAVESRQDTMSAVSKQSSSGFSVSIPVYGPGNFGASVSMSKANANADYKSVVEQTAIKAGDGGFDIKVAGNTDLKGATISSSDKAVENNKNSLTTGTLTTSDIQNSTSANADTSGYSLSTDMFTGKYAAVKGVAQNLLNNANVSTSDSSVAKSAVSKSNIKITDEARQKALTGKTAEQTAKSVNTNTSDTNKALVKADIEAVKQKAKDEQALKMLAYEAVTAIADPIAKMHSGKQSTIIGLSCDKNGICEQREISTSQSLKADKDGNIYVFNNGINNTSDGAIKNAIVQVPDGVDTKNIYVVANPHTGNMLTEIVYAGWDKFFSPIFGVSDATENRNAIMLKAKEQGINVVEIDHSRGNITSYNGNLEFVKAGETNIPLSQVQMNGSPVNANDMSRVVSIITSGNKAQTSVYQSTHQNDLVSTFIGGNTSTGGLPSSFYESHTNYVGYLPVNNDEIMKKLEQVWGASQKSQSILVQPSNVQGNIR